MDRILLVSHELSVTGAPNSLLRQAKYMLEAGYDVDVWTFRDGPLRACYEEAGLPPKVIEESRAGVEAALVPGTCAYNLAVCNTIRTYRAADMLQWRGIPTVWFVRETRLLDEDHWMNPDFARVFDGFGSLYTISDYNADVVRKYNSNVKVVHNAVPDTFHAFSSPTDHVRFGYIGSYVDWKGVDLLVEAFAEVRAVHPAVELFLAGRPWTDWGVSLKAGCEGAPGVRWVGEVQGEEKERFFDSVDVLCVPSLDEPCGLVVLEGLMHGKPVITTDHTGANYAVGPHCGRVVKAGSVTALASAMSELCGLGSFAEMGRRARESYLSCATPELEREAVLRMVSENAGHTPVVRAKPGRDDTPFFHEVRSMTGRRRFYLGGLKVFSFKGRGIRKRMEEC